MIFSSMQIKWIYNVAWMKVIQVGICYTILTTIIKQIESIIMMQYYSSEIYRGVWSKFLAPTVGPRPFEFFVNYFIGTFLTGVSLCIIYYYLKSYLPKKKWERTFFFADVLVATSFVFFTIPVYILFNVPLALLGSWFITTFICVVSASMLIVHILPEK